MVSVDRKKKMGLDLNRRRQRARVKAQQALAQRYPDEFQELRKAFLDEEMIWYHRIWGETK